MLHLLAARNALATLVAAAAGCTPTLAHMPLSKGTVDLARHEVCPSRQEIARRLDPSDRYERHVVSIDGGPELSFATHRRPSCRYRVHYARCAEVGEQRLVLEDFDPTNASSFRCPTPEAAQAMLSPAERPDGCGTPEVLGMGTFEADASCVYWVTTTAPDMPLSLPWR